MRSPDIRFAVKTATANEIAGHLERCDSDFIPPLSRRLDIPTYAKKLHRHSVTYEAWANDDLVGLIAAYHKPEGGAYISSVSTLRDMRGVGVGKRLLLSCLTDVDLENPGPVELEVATGSAPALALYHQMGFEPISTRGDVVTMRRDGSASGMIVKRARP